MRVALFVLTLLLLPLLFHAPRVAGATSDFTLSAFYTYVTGTPTDTIILTGQNGYAGFITLTLSPPPPGFYSSLDRNNATITTSTASVNRFLFASASQPGNYAVTITASQGSLSHSLTITYNVISGTDPNFSIDSSQGLSYGWHILRGSSSASGIVVTSTNGFAGTVSLQAASFPPGLVLSFDRSSVKVQPGSSGLASMGLSVPMTVPVGTYTVVLNGTSGTITQVVYLDVLVDYGFALKASPISLTLPQGGQTTSTVTLSSLGGWTGTTGLSATCPGLTCSFNPPSLQLTDPAITAQSILTVAASSTTLPGRYGVSIAETNPMPVPSYTQRADLTAVVIGPDFTVSASPGALTFTPGVAGSLQTTVTLTSLAGFSGYVNTTVSVSPSVGPALPDPPSASPNFTRIQITPSAPQSFTIRVSVDMMVMEGPYLVKINAVTQMPGGLLSHAFYVVTTVGPDFSISASSANLIIHQGTLATSIVTFTSLNGFAGGIMLLLEPFSALPPDPRNSFFPSYPILVPGGTNSTELVVIADQFTGLGTFNAWVDASTSVQVGFGWVSHSFPITITVEGPVTGPDFSISAQTSNLDLSIGSTTTSTVSLSSVNGFGGALTLQAEGYIPRSLSPASVTISPAISGSSTLSATAPTSNQIDGYPLWYTSSGHTSLLVIASNSTGFSHWVWVNETISPVRVDTNPTRLDIPTGQSATSQIIVSSLSGFNLTVSMSAIILPSGPTTLLSNSFINFSSSTAPVSLALTISVPSTVAQGDYVVLVTATSMSHQWFCQCGYYNITITTPIYVRAVAPSVPGPNPLPKPNGSTAGIFGLPPTEFYGIIAAAAIALVVSAGYLGFRWRKKVGKVSLPLA